MLKQFLKKTSSAVLMKQKLSMYLSFLVVLLIFVGVYWALPDSEKQSSAVQSLNIASAGNVLDPEETWRYGVEDIQSESKKDIAQLKQKLDVVIGEKEAQAELLQSRLDEMEAAVAAQAEQIHNQRNVPENPGHSNPAQRSDLFGGPQLPGQNTSLAQPVVQIAQVANPIQKFEVKLTVQKGVAEKKIKTVDNTIPAGTIAPSVLLSGVDATVALEASSDPIPMLLRIVDLGTLPRGFSGDMEDCHIVASGYGDLSSERVFARAETLSCVERSSGEIIETSVAGFIAGGDGRAGIRGRVVSKEGKYLARGFAGGIFSGLSHIANPPASGAILPLSTDGKIPREKTSDLFRSGVSQGVGNSLDQISQYYIKRAEQIQPIIQVSAGQAVDIVFTSSSSIGSTEVRQKIAQERFKARQQAQSNVSGLVKNITSNLKENKHGF